MKIITAIVFLGCTLAISAPSPQTVPIGLMWPDYSFASNSNVIGFRIYYGAGPKIITNWNGTNIVCGCYTNSVMVGMVTNHVFQGMARGTTYYFAATAITTNDGFVVETIYSNEVRTNTPPKLSGPPNLRGQ